MILFTWFKPVELEKLSWNEPYSLKTANQAPPHSLSHTWTILDGTPAVPNLLLDNSLYIDESICFWILAAERLNELATQEKTL